MRRRFHKARKTTDLRTDLSSQEYWEEVLARFNLRESRGRDTRLIYLPNPILEKIDGEIRTESGKVESGEYDDV